MLLFPKGFYFLLLLGSQLLLPNAQATASDLFPHYYLTVTARNANTGDRLDLRVKIKDQEWDKLVGSVKTNTGEGPKNFTRLRTGRRYQLLMSQSGYADKTVKLDLTQEGNWREFEVNEEDSTLHVITDMARPKDKSSFAYFHIYFWDNSTVLLKEPKKELEDLLSLMREVPEAEIELTGHVDGQRFRKYKQVAPQKSGKAKIFNLSRENPEKTGSANHFSEERAETVKMYLVQNGIGPDRIKVNGKGTRFADYDMAEAYKNNRIEITIRR